VKLYGANTSKKYTTRQVAEQYEILKNADKNGRLPSRRALADAAKVSPSFAWKLIDELARYG
jgi:DNA-binding transcriptional regulator YhcF (GntR family)